MLCTKRIRASALFQRKQESPKVRHRGCNRHLRRGAERVGVALHGASLELTHPRWSVGARASHGEAQERKAGQGHEHGARSSLVQEHGVSRLGIRRAGARPRGSLGRQRYVPKRDRRIRINEQKHRDTETHRPRACVRRAKVPQAGIMRGACNLTQHSGLL